MNGIKALGDWVVAMVTKQKLLYQLEIFVDLKGLSGCYGYQTKAVISTWNFCRP